jgi:streptogramin lyase
MKLRAAISGLRFDLGDATPLYLAIGERQSLWATCDATAELARLKRDGSVDRFALDAPPHQIARGGDSMWFTIPSIDAVGRIDRAGILHTYSLPEGSAPTGIDANRSGSWVTLRGSGQLASVSTKGAITVVSTGIDYENPTLLAMKGAPSHVVIDETDGSLWFTLTGLAEVGHRFDRGAAKYWSDPDCVEPTGIALDPQSVWVTDFGGGGIWRIRRLTARLERFAAWPSGTSVAIARDNRGGCWFSELEADTVAHCGDDGAFTQLDVSPYGTHPRGIVVDDDGVAWVAMASGGIVGVRGRAS